MSTEARASMDRGLALLDAGQPAGAEAAFREALRLDPSHGPALVNLGAVLQGTGRAAEAEQCYRRALEVAPTLAQAHFNLGTLLLGLGRPAQALACIDEAVRREASPSGWLEPLGWLLKESGDAERASSVWTRLRALRPDSAIAGTELLRLAERDPTIDDRRLGQLREEWAQGVHACVARLPAPAPTPEEPRRALRVGYFAADFADAALAELLLPVLQAHDPEEVEVRCYCDAESDDAATWRLRRAVRAWHATGAIDDERLAERIRDDGIDVLVFLDGHGSRRMGMVARQPAPVQFSWLGGALPIGLDTLEALDERPCLPPRAPVPPEEPHPGPVFGAIQPLADLSRRTVDLWAAALRAVPGARLLLGLRGMHELGGWVNAALEAQGVDASRIEHVHLALHAPVDPLLSRIGVMLDAWPGGAPGPALQALREGLPVVTVRSASPRLARVAQLLEAAQLADTVADDEAGFAMAAARALHLASSPGSRASRAARFAASALADVPARARSLEARYREAWRRRLGEAPRTVPAIRAAAPAGAAAPRVVIDGVFFQYSDSGIARVWRNVLRQWGSEAFGERVLLLDREGSAPAVPGIRTRRIPRHRYEDLAADRALLQRCCDEEGATVFASTYYSRPISTATVLLVYDMIPEVTGAPALPVWREKTEAIAGARRFVSISRSTVRDLRRVHPHLAEDAIRVAHLAADPAFFPAGEAEIQAFRQRHRLQVPHVLIVGARGGYKNADLAFRALRDLPPAVRPPIVCVGGEDGWDAGQEALAPVRLRLADEDLRLAYAAAEALVYPSFHEGFGLPVLEAMACGCPVITTSHASLPEAGGEAAVYVHPGDAQGLLAALQALRDPEWRASRVALGLRHASRFRWSAVAEALHEALVLAAPAPAAAHA